MRAVLPGRRILKAVAEVFFKRVNAVERKHCSTKIGTKRRRCVTSGADEALEQEAGEDEDDDEGILPRLWISIARLIARSSTFSRRMSRILMVMSDGSNELLAACQEMPALRTRGKQDVLATLLTYSDRESRGRKQIERMTS